MDSDDTLRGIESTDPSSSEASGKTQAAAPSASPLLEEVTTGESDESPHTSFAAVLIQGERVSHSTPMLSENFIFGNYNLAVFEWMKENRKFAVR